MLAPEDHKRTTISCSASLADEIVELVVLSVDEAFLQTLRETVGPSRRLWQVSTSDKVGDMLLAGGVGILVLDVQALRQAGAPFITQIKQQFPDLVIVVAGPRDTEAELTRLISDGTVYRFIHKPMSPARAKLFADAAVKRYKDQRRRTDRASPRSAPPLRTGGLAVVGGCVAICAVMASLWMLTRGSRQSASPAPLTEDPEASRESPPVLPSAGAGLLARASQALAANRLASPAGDNALELYSQVLARDPGSSDARLGIAAVRERLLARAVNAMMGDSLDEAADAIEIARRAGAPGARISLLTAELAKARAQATAGAIAAHAAAAHAAAGVVADGVAAAPDPAERAAGLAMQRIREGRLVDPERDNARFYLQEALDSNPGSEAAERAGEALALGLLNAARGAIERNDLKAAAAWLEDAEGVASPTNVANLRRLLGAAEHRNDEAAAAPGTGEPAVRADRGAEAEHVSLPAAPTAGPARVIDSGKLVIVKSVQPDYPRQARDASIEGWVELDFTVTELGRVEDIAVRAANPPQVFERAAVSALSQWRYEPVLVDARPVSQRARIRIRFALAQ